MCTGFVSEALQRQPLSKKSCRKVSYVQVNQLKSIEKYTVAE